MKAGPVRVIWPASSNETLGPMASRIFGEVAPPDAAGDEAEDEDAEELEEASEVVEELEEAKEVA